MKKKKSMLRSFTGSGSLLPALISALLLPLFPSTDFVCLAYRGPSGFDMEIRDAGRFSSGAVGSFRIARGRRGEGTGQNTFMKSYEEWRQMSPEEKARLRRQYEKWKDLSPQDRDLYQRRFEQWQKLSPGDRKQLREKLDRWDDLSPREREKIRKRFKP